ncbi:transforming growth factor beta activator LRRC33-like isoform X2 [Rhincodon typus]|uniref:transforming growth factor beta activator LRRC33-like isoform X2 n=1 Tax=Rhincodon typus TaxID=259920 RepID=UPI00202EB3FC|nr:transforming growth factor beta activator LRRC33-like isoform X2 [Rhincodon typus]
MNCWLLLWFTALSCLGKSSSDDTSTGFTVCQKKDHVVSCQYQNLSKVPDLPMLETETIDLSHNSIKALTEESLLNFSSLQHLDVSYNQLKTITSGALAHLTNLRMLFLANNHLGRSFSSGLETFSQLKKLKVLNLSENFWDSDTVSQHLKNLSSLEKIHLSGNLLMKLTPDMFCGMQLLKYIFLEKNYITEITVGSFECLANLVELNLAMNSLSCISNFHLPKLQVLNLSRNGIEFFMTDENEDEHHLQVLDLSHNRRAGVSRWKDRQESLHKGILEDVKHYHQPWESLAYDQSNGEGSVRMMTNKLRGFVRKTQRQSGSVREMAETSQQLIYLTLEAPPTLFATESTVHVF